MMYELDLSEMNAYVEIQSRFRSKSRRTQRSRCCIPFRDWPEIEMQIEIDASIVLSYVLALRRSRGGAAYYVCKREERERVAGGRPV